MVFPHRLENRANPADRRIAVVRIISLDRTAVPVSSLDMQGPLVSVIVPCFNGAQAIERCFASLVLQGAKIEIVLVDDGSTDASLSLAASLIRTLPAQIIVLSQKNQGQAAARNLGIRASSGKYWCFLDVDDELSPGSLAAAVEVLESSSAIAAVSGRIELINLHRTVEPWQRESMEETMLGNVVIRAEVVREIGGFPVDSAFRGKAAGEDGVFRLQIARFGKVVKLDRAILHYHAQRGSHVDFFLDRAVKRSDGSIGFIEHSTEERDGSLHAAFNKYVDGVSSHLLGRVLLDIQRELGGGVEVLRMQQELAGEATADVDLFEAFALSCFSKRWPVAGTAVIVGGATARSTQWLAAGCKGAGNARLVNLDCFPEKGAPSATPPLRARADYAAFVQIISDASERTLQDWTEPVRLLCIPSIAPLPHPCYDPTRWLQHITRFGILVVNRTMHGSLGNAAALKHLLTLQRLAVFQKL